MTMSYELSKDFGIALKINGEFVSLRKGIKKIRKISDPYTKSTFYVNNNFAKTEVLGVKKFLRIAGTKISDDLANAYICSLYGKTGEDCCSEAILFNRKTLKNGICTGVLVPVAIVMKAQVAESSPEDDPFVNFECDIFINGEETVGTFSITEV